MDAFEQIASVFEEDCLNRLAVLENATAIVEHSESIGVALRLIFVQSQIYADDYENLKMIPTEIERLRNCIATTEVIVPSLYVFGYTILIVFTRKPLIKRGSYSF
jgi:hypothetical protein